MVPTRLKDRIVSGIRGLKFWVESKDHYLMNIWLNLIKVTFSNFVGVCKLIVAYSALCSAALSELV